MKIKDGVRVVMATLTMGIISPGVKYRIGENTPTNR
jgi:hypothetical protein